MDAKQVAAESLSHTATGLERVGLIVDRNALSQLSHTPMMSSDPADQAEPSVRGEALDSEALDMPEAANG